ncbi:MAG: hypothetical protein N2Z84_00105 [Atribacterota bacterium]|nr:hypothetical protein [Atribacterota bacterium]
MGKTQFFLAIDPGKEKVGMAVLSEEGKIKWMGIVNVVNLRQEIQMLQSKFSFQKVVLGASTGKDRVVEILRELNLEVMLVDERYSSEEARKLYFKERFPSFWKKILPLSFLSPSRPYDDWQAVVIGRRYLRNRRDEALE